MIYGGKDLLSKSNKVNTSPAINTIDPEKSIFVEALNIMRDDNTIINQYLVDAKCKVAVSESKNTTILNEFNIKKLGKSIVDLFIDTIKAIFTAFKNAMLKLFATDKTIEKHSAELKSITQPFNVTFERFNYTYLDADIPDLSPKIEFDGIYDDLQAKLKKLANSKSDAERKAKLESIEADINSTDLTAYYDNLRARVLKRDYKYISKDYYSDELYNVFRGGGKYITSKVTPQEVTVTLDRFLRNKQIIKEVEKEQDKLIADANKIKAALNDTTLEKLDANYAAKPLYDIDQEAIFQKIMSAKLGQINEMLQIYEMAFSAKLDAIKESYLQDRNVLIEALQFYNTSKLK